ALRTGDPARARRPALAAIAADPLDEAAHRALMRAHVLAGQQDQAARVYARLRAALAAELGIDPAPATRDLLRSILQQDCNAGRDADVVPIP
ncbi:MAG: AfsR/SARP family transcriptional regulator, partial [Actinophytocola sp.]|uniref:AfsR/SARP family transcriptional regulator n=1 Tax=Actinophytocola sp. TaxID=1872138 RepID=UPI003D6AB7BF